MAIIDKIKVGSTTYDVSPSASGTLNTSGTTKFASSDVAQGSATSWTNVDQMTTADNHATLFTKITQMAKNVRYLYNVLGTGFSTGSTVKGQIDGKAPANHSHSVSQLPTSSTQVNSNDYIPTSALIYSMNQTLTSLNDASNKLGVQIYNTKYAVGGIPTKSQFSANDTIQSIIIKMLGDMGQRPIDTSTPNTRYKSQNLGTWSSTADVDNFLYSCCHDTGYYGATIGSYVTINDGTYNKQWIIAGFDCEYNYKIFDVNNSVSVINDNGYGICLIPKNSLGNATWDGDNRSYSGYYGSTMHTYTLPTVANNLKKVLGNHLIKRNVLLSNSRADTYGQPHCANGYSWTTAYCTLMSMGQITGKFASNDNKYDDGEANYKLPLFNYETWSFDTWAWLRGLYSGNVSGGYGGIYGLNTSGGSEYADYGSWSGNYGLRPLIYIR